MNTISKKIIKQAEEFCNQFQGKSFNEVQKISHTREIGDDLKMCYLGGKRVQVMRKIHFPNGASLAQWARVGVLLNTDFEEDGVAKSISSVGNMSRLAIDAGLLKQPTEVITTCWRLEKDLDFK